MVLLNTAGGVTGGDRFSVDINAGQATAVTLTTQAAERAYRAQPGETGRVRNRLAAETAAHVNWLPQETILFDGSRLNRSLSIELAADATLLLVEPLVFGRAAMGECISDARFRDRIEVYRDNAPIFLDAMRLNGDITAYLAQANIGGGAGAMASLLYVAPDAELHLAAIRSRLPATAGASLISNDVLFLRALAPDSYELRATLVPIIERLKGGELPRPWMI